MESHRVVGGKFAFIDSESASRVECVNEPYEPLDKKSSKQASHRNDADFVKTSLPAM